MRLVLQMEEMGRCSLPAVAMLVCSVYLVITVFYLQIFYTEQLHGNFANRKRPFYKENRKKKKRGIPNIKMSRGQQ